MGANLPATTRESDFPLLLRLNGIAALTFCDVGIASSATAEPTRVLFKPTIESLNQ